MQNLHSLVKVYEKDLWIPAIPDFSNDENIARALSKIMFQQKFWSSYRDSFEVLLQTEKEWNRWHSLNSFSTNVARHPQRDKIIQYRTTSFGRVFLKNAQSQFLTTIWPTAAFSLFDLIKELSEKRVYLQFQKIEKLAEMPVIFPPYECDPQYRKNLRKFVRIYRARYMDFVRRLNEKSDFSFDLCWNFFKHLLLSECFFISIFLFDNIYSSIQIYLFHLVNIFQNFQKGEKMGKMLFFVQFQSARMQRSSFVDFLRNDSIVARRYRAKTRW